MSYNGNVSVGPRIDRVIVLLALERDGLVLQHAPEELRADRGVVLVAVAQNGQALEYAWTLLQEDVGVSDHFRHPSL